MTLSIITLYVLMDLEDVVDLMDFMDLAPSDLQPHYGNGVFGNVYLLAKR